MIVRGLLGALTIVAGSVQAAESMSEPKERPFTEASEVWLEKNDVVMAEYASKRMNSLLEKYVRGMSGKRGSKESIGFFVSNYYDQALAKPGQMAPLDEQASQYFTGFSSPSPSGFRLVIISIILAPEDARLELNGLPTQRSPRNLYGVAAGELRVHASLAGYKDCDRRVIVEPASPPVIECLLEPN